MERITFILEQHTPMLHFQPLQEKAGLRATEVKPRFDRWLVGREWNGNYNACKLHLIGYQQDKDDEYHEKFDTGYRALNYKMRIEPQKDITSMVSMPKIPAKKRGERITHQLLMTPLETTHAYPCQKQSVIMSNIGGRLPDEVVNFRLYDKVEITIATEDSVLADVVRRRFEEFIISVNFGNRKSKGFGSFAVSEVDGQSVEGYDVSSPWIITLSLQSKSNYPMSIDSAYKDLFAIINKLWRSLKSNFRGNRKSNKSVLLGMDSNTLGNVSRIPSPIIFKPIVLEKSSRQWDVAMEVFYDEDVISKACSSGAKAQYDIYINDLKRIICQADMTEFAEKLQLSNSLTKLEIITLDEL